GRAEAVRQGSANCHLPAAVDPLMRLKVPARLPPGSVAGMLNYLKKFAMEILPSVAATIIGAYIVNHYINTKPAEPPAAAVSTPAPRAQRAARRPEPAATPEPGARARGTSDREMRETGAAGGPAEVKPDAKPAETATEEAKPAESSKPEVATAPHRRDAADLA